MAVSIKVSIWLETLHIVKCVDIEHWKFCERFEWLNIVLVLIEYILNISDTISKCFTLSVMTK